MTTPFLLGLTGSIGMGKSTTAAMFKSLGVPVWDADAAVGRLYAKGGAGVSPVAGLFPDVVVEGSVSRDRLRAHVASNPDTLGQLERIIHPLVAIDRTGFVTQATGDLLLLDIPLLFENGTEAGLNATLLVTAPAELQRSRVLARPGMTESLFTTILNRQMPDAEKRRRATHVVETLDLASTQAYVQAIVTYIRGAHA